MTGTVDRRAEEDGVELLLLRHPPVNALSTALLEALDGHVRHLATDAACRAVIVTGDGAYFSAGADLKEIATLDRASAPAIVRRGQELFGRLADLPVPVVAAINGLALGGGLELALACDLRVAAETAKLGAPETTYGLMPAYGGTQRLARLVGPAKAKELIFTGGLVPASEALRIGLVNRVVSGVQALRAARDLAHTIGQRAPLAVRAAKRAISDGGDRGLGAGLELEAQLFVQEIAPSADLAEGLRAFAERRPPKFTGR